jgi:DNA modification methylase
MAIPSHKLFYVPTDSLHPSPRNARTHSREQVRQIARSIQAFGFINPVVVDEHGVLVAGHGRLLAARELGLARVPAIRVSHLSEAEKRAYALADNKIAENAGWDSGLLRVELAFLAELNVDLELTGFSPPEIDLALGFGEQVPEPPVPELAGAEEVPVGLGDLWQLGPHRLICGDCREPAMLDRLLAGGRARMIFTDPPYNVSIQRHARKSGRVRHREFVMGSGEMTLAEFEAFLQESLGQLARVSVEGALAFVCMDWRHLEELLSAGRAIFSELVNLCVWDKGAGGMGSLYRSQHELVLLFKKGHAGHINNVQLGQHGRNRTNVWRYPGANSFGAGRNEALALHPTVKPVAMIADAILDTSRRGEIVLDGFIGSGSTLLAAERTGRIFRGIELDPRYVDVTLRRWREVTGEEPLHGESGQSYAARAKSQAPPQRSRRS